MFIGTSLVVPWVKTQYFHCPGLSSILDEGIKTLQTAWRNRKKKKGKGREKKGREEGRKKDQKKGKERKKNLSTFINVITRALFLQGRQGWPRS